MPWNFQWVFCLRSSVNISLRHFHVLLVLQYKWCTVVSETRILEQMWFLNKTYNCYRCGRCSLYLVGLQIFVTVAQQVMAMSRDSIHTRVSSAAEVNMADVSERTLQVAIVVSFAAGFVAGWQANRMRRKFLDWRKKRLQDKLAETQKKLDLSWQIQNITQPTWWDETCAFRNCRINGFRW